MILDAFHASGPVQFIIAMIASALTDRLTREMDRIREEQRILELLQQATGKKRFASPRTIDAA